MPDVTELTPMSQIGLRNVSRYEKHSTALVHELSGRSDPDVWRSVADAVLDLRAPSDHPTADTILFAPKDAERRRQVLGGRDDFTVDSYTHESASDHVEVARVKFRPNRMWTFFRTPASLHGIEKLTEESAPRFIMAAHYKFATV